MMKSLSKVYTSICLLSVYDSFLFNLFHNQSGVFLMKGTNTLSILKWTVGVWNSRAK